MQQSNKPAGPLAGIRILDLTDERAIYGCKLLADLGADVVRPEPPSGDPLRKRGPFLEGAEPPVSLWHAFFASSRRFFALDPATADGRAQLARLVDAAHIVMTSRGGFAVAEADLVAARTRRPALIVIETSSFGRQGPWSNYLAPDLVAGALGGAAATTGDVDTPPLKLFGELNFATVGAYAAIAALAALYSSQETGSGQRGEVSAHECIASCLEHVFLWYWYQYRRPEPEGAFIPRQGSLHWGKAYKVMQAKGGSIMVTPTPDPDNQVAWLAEEDAHQDLFEPRWADPLNRPGYVPHLMRILAEWVANKDVEALFHEAQARHCPFGHVLPIDKVAENPQLEARNWWVPYQLGDREVRGSGAPYRFSDTPWSLRAPAAAGADTAAILKDIGWNEGSR